MSAELFCCQAPLVFGGGRKLAWCGEDDVPALLFPLLSSDDSAAAGRADLKGTHTGFPISALWLQLQAFF